jgi:hypothetical protein
MHLSAANSVTSARIAGLRYVTDQLPGVRRIGGKRTFRYIAPNDQPLDDNDMHIKTLRAGAIYVEALFAS